MDWNGNLLTYAHDSGVSVLSPIPKESQLAKNLPSDFQQEWVFQLTNVKTSSPVTHVRFTSKYLVVAQEDRKIVVVNHLDGSRIQYGSSTDQERAHSDDINSIDVSDDGLVVSCGDDRKVIVWESGHAKVAHVDNVPTLVKIWMDQDSDKIIVVENGASVKVLDWRKNEWLYTIYPQPFVQGTKPNILDVLTQNGKVVVIGEGWWKEYNPLELQGGAGFTYANSEGQLSGWTVNSKYISCHSKHSLIGGIGSDRSCFYDLGDKSGQVYQFRLLLPSVSVPAGAINHNGIAAFASGSKLVLIKPFETYEVVQY
jgi:hypothetical protein